MHLLLYVKYFYKILSNIAMMINKYKQLVFMIKTSDSSNFLISLLFILTKLFIYAKVINISEISHAE